MSEKKSTEVAVIPNAGALANIDFGEHAGGGKQNMTSADQAIPFLSVLQALSKVISDPGQKVEGAQPGMIMDSVTKELYSGEDGVVVVPCNTARVFVEWEGDPGSGKVVNRFSPSDPVVTAAKAKHAFGQEQTPAGNRLVETFYIVAMILADSEATVPSGFALIPFTSTKIKPYKESIGVIHTLIGDPPLYAFRLRFRTRPETRPKGTSFNFVIMPDGYEGNAFKEGIMAGFMAPDSPQGQALYPLAKQLAEDFDNGILNIAYDTEGAGGGGGDSEDEPY
jgi:hypothetical protein